MDILNDRRKGYASARGSPGSVRAAVWCALHRAELARTAAK